MTPFDELRAALKLPYHDEPYHRVLARAEAEVVATREAAVFMLDACIRTNRADAAADVLYWANQAHAARRRLEAVRDRKRLPRPNEAGTCPHCSSQLPVGETVHRCQTLNRSLQRHKQT